MKKSPTIFLIIFLILIPLVSVFAYDAKTTHPNLSEITINFYNQKTLSNSINTLEKQWIIEGSIEEDQGIRCLNHFYDPVFNDTWEFGGIDYLFPALTAKNWGQNPFAQAVYDPLYLALIGPIVKSPVFSKTNFSWQRAIYEYIKGNKQMAFKSLGHILHLIQDLSVPEHTRANAHIFFISNASSPYEVYTAKNIKNFYAPITTKLQKFEYIKKSSLNEYFDSMALYSNNYFYSPDTISNLKYSLPQIALAEFPEIQNGKQFFYVMGKDENGDLFHLALVLKNNIGWRLTSGPAIFSLEDEKVLNDYWERLSLKAVLNGAGVIDLFFKEIAKVKTDTKFITKNESNFLLAAIGGITKFINDVFQKDSDFILIENSSDSLKNDSNLVDDSDFIISQTTTTTKKPITSTTTKLLVTTTTLGATTTTKPKITTTTTKLTTTTTKQKEVILCSFNTTQLPKQNKIIINEVAWMGAQNNANSEWIELKNITSQAIDISNWQLLDKDKQIKINFDPGSKLPAFGFYLLERTSDEAVPHIRADYIYTGVLNNTDEGLYLFDQNCQLQDQVLANPDWPAGNNLEKRTMERKTDLTWQTSTEINGTPKRENSDGFMPVSDSDGNSSGSSLEPTTTTTKPITTTTTLLPNYPKILITEIKISGMSAEGKVNTYDEFIELFNPNDIDIDLNGWYLQKKTSQAEEYSSLVPSKLLEGKYINAHSFLLITHSSSSDAQIADILISNYSVTDNNTIVLKNPNREIVDKVGFGIANDCVGVCALNPEPSQSIQRKFLDNIFINTNSNFDDFEIQNCPNPKDFSSDICLAPIINKESPKPKIPYITEFSWHPFEEGSSRIVIDFKTDFFPFIPPTDVTNNIFTAMAFYLHTDLDEPSENFGVPWDYLGDKYNWELNNSVSGLKLTYPTYVSGTRQVQSIIFTTDANLASNSAAPRKLAHRIDKLPQDNHFIIDITDTTQGQGLSFSPNQYITIGYYGYSRSTTSYLKLIAYDDTKFYFNPLKYYHQPTNVSNFSVECDNEICDNLIFSWMPATDIDPEDYLQYNIQYVFAKQGDNLENNDLTRNTWEWSSSQDVKGETILNTLSNRFELKVLTEDLYYINSKRLPGVHLDVFFGIKAQDSVGLKSELPKIIYFHIPPKEF